MMTGAELKIIILALAIVPRILLGIAILFDGLQKRGEK